MALSIVHDPGHGGEDDRGVQWGGIVEAKWSATMAEDCLHQLSHWHVRQTMTRSKDESISLEARGTASEEAGADLVISHHVNAIYHPDILPNGQPHPQAGQANPDVDGLMVFYLSGDWVGHEVGAAIMRAAPSELLRRKPNPYPASPGDWTQRAHAVLKHHNPRPAILIEYGFATAPRDVAVLQATASRPALVTAVQAGVSRLVELRRAA